MATMGSLLAREEAHAMCSGPSLLRHVRICQHNRAMGTFRLAAEVTVASGSITGLPHVHAQMGLPLDFVRHVSCPSFYRRSPGEGRKFGARECP